MSEKILNSARVLVPHHATHGEGPVWDAARKILYWVDLTSGRLHAWHESDAGLRTMSFAEPVCALDPMAGGGFLVALAKRVVECDADGHIQREVCRIEPDLPGNRCNDGKRDPAGRFWIGTMSGDGSVAGAGSLYRLDGESSTRILGDLTISNGMGWSGDSRTMFFIDSPTREVWAFDFDPETSAISNRRTIVRVPADLGVPDGLCVAPDDTIFVAHWGASCVCRWDPRDGRLIARIDTGCPHTTSCCLSPNGRLFITTSRLGLSEADLAAAPDSGSVFVMDPR